MKCIKCGKESGKLINNICRNCYSKSPLINNFKTINLKYCNFCKKFIYKNKQISDLKPIILDHLVVTDHAVIDEIDFDLLFDKSSIDVTLIGHFDFDKSKEIEESYVFKINLVQFMCNDCKKKSSQAYSAIIQLRNKKNKYYDNISKYIENSISNNKSTNIVKIEESSSGLDYYITNTDFGMTLAKKIMEKYGAEVKTSKKLYGMDQQRSKQVFRVTILVRLFDFSVGDLIYFKDDIFKISKILKNVLTIKDLYSKKVKKIDRSDDFDLINKIDIFETSIISVKPSYKVLDDKYQEINLTTSKKHKINDKVKVLFNKNIAYEV